MKQLIRIAVIGLLFGVTASWLFLQYQGQKSLLFETENKTAKTRFELIELRAKNVAMREARLSHEAARQNKIDRINAFMSRYLNNPYVGKGELFLSLSEKYNIPWTWLPAVTIAEQGNTCSERINCFGMNINHYGRLGTREQEAERAAELLARIGITRWAPSGNGYAGLRFVSQI